MNRSIRLPVVIGGILLATGGVSRASYATVLDQIGPDSSSLQPGFAFTSQYFGPPYVSFSIAAVAHFAIDGPGLTLSEVDAAFLGFGGFVPADFAAITGYNVGIYSTVAAAAHSLTGDVANFNVKAASVGLTTAFGPADSALAQIPINLALGEGSYYVGVTVSLDFTATNGAEIGVYGSSIGGDSGVFQVNPGGGFGFVGNNSMLTANAAYRILAKPAADATPAPPSLLLCGIAGVLGLGWARARRGRPA